MRTEQEMVAYALEIDPDLLPYLPELLTDLDELGSDAELIAEVFATMNLPRETRIVDLGCGKGAVAVEIAGETGFEVTGIELFEPFIDLCHDLARRNDVTDLCEFRFGNVLDMAKTVGEFDVAIFSALGDVLGGPDATINVIRNYVKPGGLIIISDLFLADGGSNDFPGFERYLHHDDTVALLTAHGDTLIKEVVYDPEDDDEADEEEDEAEKIRIRAAALAIEHPHLKDALMEFAASQADENAFVDENFVDSIWVLKRN